MQDARRAIRNDARVPSTTRRFACWRAAVQFGHEFGPLAAEQRVGLMMREEDHFALAGGVDDPLEPRDLVAGEVVVFVRAVETDEQPVVVLQRKIACGLAECGEHGAEVSFAACVHFVIGVAGAAQRAGALRPFSRNRVRASFCVPE